ncbi:hypothetical protein [Aureimonas mangrovi]|uniref:hypothetical protein n=1 Tax=Aureimonas mangrovi TaxID=2758041 RepID=UPI00163DAA3A|nr:hypothetical protein [Aureimonas mangrovi]
MRQNGINVHRFAEGLGIRVRPIHRSRRRRPAMETYALGTIRNMLILDGEDHTSLVLRCVVASDPSALGADVITSVSNALKGHPGRFPSRREAMEWFEALPMLALRARAHRLGTGPHALTTLIADRMIGE